MTSRTKISSGAGTDASRELCMVRIFAGRPLSRRVKSQGGRCETGFPAESATTRSMLKRPSRTTESVALRGAHGFCATDGSRKGGVCPPAPQVPRIIMPAINDVRCGLSRFTTVNTPRNLAASIAWNAPEARCETAVSSRWTRRPLQKRGDVGESPATRKLCSCPNNRHPG